MGTAGIMLGRFQNEHLKHLRIFLWTTLELWIRILEHCWFHKLYSTFFGVNIWQFPAYLSISIFFQKFWELCPLKPFWNIFTYYPTTVDLYIKTLVVP
jgi:hypothetical protein